MCWPFCFRCFKVCQHASLSCMYCSMCFITLGLNHYSSIVFVFLCNREPRTCQVLPPAIGTAPGDSAGSIHSVPKVCKIKGSGGFSISCIVAGILSAIDCMQGLVVILSGKYVRMG